MPFQNIDFQNILQSLIAWFSSHGIKIILILIAAHFVNRVLRVFIEKAIKRAITDKLDGAGRKRAETLIGVLGGTLKFIIWAVALLTILPEFGINIAPILAGVGLMGLAVGMASKDIISDFISGLFILLENQYQIGDKVKIAGIEGIIEEITLRRTILKDSEGVLHYIPNSQIKGVAKKLKKT